MSPENNELDEVLDQILEQQRADIVQELSERATAAAIERMERAGVHMVDLRRSRK